MDLNRPWRFDAAVAASFDGHVRQNIPGYEHVVSLSLDVVKATCDKHDRIAEVGCATGYTLNALEAAGFTAVFGIDNSQSMLDKCAVRTARLICSDTFPVHAGPFQAVLMNWTLHFVAQQQRAGYLHDIRASLAPGGILVLSEKTQQSDLVEELYFDFKRRQGVSEAEILAKKASLAGILQPLPHAWYLQTLDTLGFAVEIVFAQCGFVTYLARLPA